MPEVWVEQVEQVMDAISDYLWQMFERHLALTETILSRMDSLLESLKRLPR